MEQWTGSRLRLPNLYAIPLSALSSNCSDLLEDVPDASGFLAENPKRQVDERQFRPVGLTFTG